MNKPIREGSLYIFLNEDNIREGKEDYSVRDS